MKDILDKFLGLPNTHKAGIWIGTLLLSCYVFWQFMYKDVYAEQTQLEEKIGDLENQIIEQERIARNLPKFREEVKKLDGKLELVLQELPDKKEIPAFLESISALAGQTGLEVTKFTPQQQQYRDFFAAVPVFIELEGTYHQLATFFDEVGHLSRIVNINEITADIVTETKEEVAIRASCVATTFRYLEEDERIGMAKPEQGRRGKKKKR